MTTPLFRIPLSIKSLMSFSQYLIIHCSLLYLEMTSHILLEKGEEKEQEQQSQLEQGVPVCGANLSSPVVDQANYIDEIHYKIGNKLYIENAD